MARNRRHILAHVVFALAIVATTAPVGAVSQPSSDVLVPYFEVDVVEPWRTSLFAVANDAPMAVDVVISVRTNWGIEMIQQHATIPAEGVFTVNLRDWLLDGRLLDRTLSPAELAHLQAAFCGEPSPQDGLYYGQCETAGRMTGYVTVRATGAYRPDSLWGDYFLICPCADYVQGETLVNIDRSVEYEPACKEHGIRFLRGGAFTGGTELLIWTARVNTPGTLPELTEDQKTPLTLRFYDEQGNLVEQQTIRIAPQERLNLADIDLPANFGWIDLYGNTELFLTAHFSAADGFSNALHSYCIVNQPGGHGPSITLEKLVNGITASSPPGPAISVGTPVTWEYFVTNDGDAPLDAVAVLDDQIGAISCPQTTLDPGGSMTCVATGTAVACEYVNVATASGTTPEGLTVEASAVAHYFGDAHPAIALEKQVNGNDADGPPGPLIDAGTMIAWTFVVTNTGGNTLSDVSVTDDDGVTPVCPKTVLVPGETMTCTASSLAQLGPQSNLATARGTPPCGPATVAVQDAAYYQGRGAAAIDLEKLVNGVDADTPPGPSISIGSPVQWSYVVTNIGAVALTGVTVTDDRGVVPVCPKTTLAAGESMTCTASGTSTLGPYVNVGTATGTPPVGPAVIDTDPANYYGLGHPAIDIEKLVNGSDADTPPGPTIPVGAPVSWAYVVTNVGDVPLTAVQVVDDRGVVPLCPKTTLAPAESMTCTASGTATFGPYVNLGTASGTPPIGSAVTDTDPAHYYGQGTPGIDLEKWVNGVDADDPPGPDIVLGTTVTFTYQVTNTGDVPLTAVAVSDDQLGAISCPKSTLAPAESMTCTATGTAACGSNLGNVAPDCECPPYHNLGTAVGTAPDGVVVQDQDPANYQAVPREGCTPGYWKYHTGSWPPTGYSPSQTVASVFANASTFPTLASKTLHQALYFDGGSGLEGAAETLLRAATAAVLNAAHPDVNYPRSPSAVITDTNPALTSGSRDVMLLLAAALDSDNNLGCPLH